MIYSSNNYFNCYNLDNIKSLEIIPQKTKLFKICSLSSSKVVNCDIGDVSNLIEKLPESV